MGSTFIPNPAFPATPLAIADGGTGSATASDARTALGLAIGTDVEAYNAALASIAGLTTAADKMIYTTGSNVYATTDLTSAGRAILDDANAAAQRTTLGLGTAQVVAVVPFEVSTPTEGATVTTSAGKTVSLLIPAADRTAVTITTPATPSDGQLWTVAGASHSIVGLTITGAGGTTVSGAIVALAADAFASYIYRLADTTWYRVG